MKPNRWSERWSNRWSERWSENYLKNYPEKPLPHNFNSLAVLELVRGGVGEGVFATDECAVDAVGFNGGDCGAVLSPRHNPFGALPAIFTFAGAASVRSIGRHGDGVGRYGEVVVAYKAVVGGGPFGAASAVECGEVELVDFHGVVGA